MKRLIALRLFAVCALAALAGALSGTTLFGWLYPRLQRPLSLPPIAVGTGEG